MTARSVSFKRQLALLTLLFIVLNSCSMTRVLDSRPSRTYGSVFSTDDAEFQTCVDFTAEFEKKFYADFIRPHCASCHSQSGAASGSTFVLQVNEDLWPETFGQLISNAALIQRFLTVNFESSDTVLALKAIGELNHGGGVVFKDRGTVQQAVSFLKKIYDQPLNCRTPPKENTMPRIDTLPDYKCETAPSAASLTANLSEIVSRNCASCHSAGQGRLRLGDVGNESHKTAAADALKHFFEAYPKGYELLLNKPLGKLQHGGGQILTTDSPDYIEFARAINSFASSECQQQ